MHVSIRNTIYICAGIIFLTVLYITLTPTLAPWKESGTFILAVKNVSFEDPGVTLGFGIDSVFLHTSNNETVRTTLRDRRVHIGPESGSLQIIIEAKAPVGTYSGLSFELKSPETRNAWQQDIPPTPITLLTEHIYLPTPFEVVEDKNSVTLLGVETSQVIHEKDSTQYYLPVFQTETRHEVIVLEYEDGTMIENGTIDHSGTYGMDWNGDMRHNFRASAFGQNQLGPTEPNWFLEDEPGIATSTEPGEVATTTSTSTTPETNNTSTSTPY